MRYAADNRAVRAVYALTTGPHRVAFYALVILAVALGVYLPVRDLYAAKRTEQILNEQIAIVDVYNKRLTKETDALLSKEGIEDAARKELGLVMPGEKSLIVKGLDEDGNVITSDSGSSSESADGSSDASSDGSSSDAGSSSSDDSASDGDAASDEPSTSAEVEQAVADVYKNSAWYWKALDAIFFFDGTGGQAVVSTGE